MFLGRQRKWTPGSDGGGGLARQHQAWSASPRLAAWPGLPRTPGGCSLQMHRARLAVPPCLFLREAGSRAGKGLSVGQGSAACLPDGWEVKACTFQCGSRNSDCDPLVHSKLLRWAYPDNQGASCRYCERVFGLVSRRLSRRSYQGQLCTDSDKLDEHLGKRADFVGRLKSGKKHLKYRAGPPGQKCRSAPGGRWRAARDRGMARAAARRTPK